MLYNRVIVPLDGSEIAEQALDHAAHLAHLSGATLHLVRVIDLNQLERYGAYGLAVEYAGLAQVADEETTVAAEYLDTVARRIAQTVPAVETHVLRGAVSNAICGYAKTGDLVVIGSHGRSGIPRWFLGSVAESIVRHAPCPVLVLRTAE